MADESFKDYVLDQLKNVGGITARAMFGGYGIYKNGLMFGLIAEKGLYFKVDDGNRLDFEAKKSEPFVYESAGRKPVAMSYWHVPDDVLEDVDALAEWAKRAHDAALKKRKEDGSRPKPRRTSIAPTRSRRR